MVSPLLFLLLTKEDKGYSPHCPHLLEPDVAGKLDVIEYWNLPKWHGQRHMVDPTYIVHVYSPSVAILCWQLNEVILLLNYQNKIVSVGHVGMNGLTKNLMFYYFKKVLIEGKDL